MTPASDPLAWMDEPSRDWDEKGRRRILRPRPDVPHGRNFSTNDYLGLAHDPRILDAARVAAERWGWGAGASPAVSGWTPIHEELAQALAAFEKTEAALLFPTGYAANLGTIAALVGPGDAVYLDRLDHASLIDGVRLAGAHPRVFPHNDVDRLAHLLDRDAGRFRRSLIAVEGVYSMDGDLAPLAEIVELADRAGAILLVDEAHGTGVFGPGGRGAASALGVAERVTIKVGTLSKALGSLGGFVAGSRKLIDWLVDRARPWLFSTALPPPAVAAARAALEIIESEPERRILLLANAAHLRTRLRERGWNLGDSSAVGPIVPLILGDDRAATACAAGLWSQGFLVPAIRPPTVPEGSSRLRFSLTALQTETDVDALIEALGLPGTLDRAP